jgi:hypothetical protein
LRSLLDFLGAGRPGAAAAAAAVGLLSGGCGDGVGIFDALLLLSSSELGGDAGGDAGGEGDDCGTADLGLLVVAVLLLLVGEGVPRMVLFGLAVVGFGGCGWLVQPQGPFN